MGAAGRPRPWAPSSRPHSSNDNSVDDLALALRAKAVLRCVRRDPERRKRFRFDSEPLVCFGNGDELGATVEVTLEPVEDTYATLLPNGALLLTREAPGRCCLLHADKAEAFVHAAI